MPAPKRGKRFGGSPAHQKLMLANLASHLIISEAGAITTTEAKAKALRPYVEKLVTKAKQTGRSNDPRNRTPSIIIPPYSPNTRICDLSISCRAAKSRICLVDSIAKLQSVFRLI